MDRSRSASRGMQYHCRRWSETWWHCSRWPRAAWWSVALKVEGPCTLNSWSGNTLLATSYQKASRSRGKTSTVVSTFCIGALTSFVDGLTRADSDSQGQDTQAATTQPAHQFFGVASSVDWTVLLRWTLRQLQRRLLHIHCSGASRIHASNCFCMWTIVHRMSSA